MRCRLCLASLIENEQHALAERALLACGRLDGVAALLPDPDLFLYACVRREAVLSCQIEGTQSSISDLMLYELEEEPGVPLDDVVEVSSYVAALDLGLELLATELPLSNRLLRRVHQRLLAHGRGSDKLPGEFRQSQVWIGGARPNNARFVPPPANRIVDCMGDLEKAIHGMRDLPILVRAGLIHVQFETIHPFLDGNGRVGRLLISLMLVEAGVLKHPLLYLSLYFKQNRDEYYRLLNTVRETGDWEAWLAFFLEGVAVTAGSAVETAHRLLALFQHDGERVRQLKRAANAMLVYNAFCARPLASVNALVARTGASYTAVNTLVEVGIIKEITGRQRDRVYSYPAYLSILSEGAEPF